MDSGKPFAISLVLICGYCTLMTTKPPMSADTDPADIVIDVAAEDSAEQATTTALVMPDRDERLENKPVGIAANATASAR